MHSWPQQFDRPTTKTKKWSWDMIEGLDDINDKIKTSINNEIQNDSSSEVSSMRDHLHQNEDKIRALEIQKQI